MDDLGGPVDCRGRPLTVGQQVIVGDFLADEEGSEHLGTTDEMVALIGTKATIGSLMPGHREFGWWVELTEDHGQHTWYARWFELAPPDAPPGLKGLVGQYKAMSSAV